MLPTAVGPSGSVRSMMPNRAAAPDLATIGFGTSAATAGRAAFAAVSRMVAGPTTPATPGCLARAACSRSRPVAVAGHARPQDQHLCRRHDACREPLRGRCLSPGWLRAARHRGDQRRAQPQGFRVHGSAEQ